MLKALCEFDSVLKLYVFDIVQQNKKNNNGSEKAFFSFTDIFGLTA